MGCIKLLFVISLLLFITNYINGITTKEEDTDLNDDINVDNEYAFTSGDTSHISGPETTANSDFKSRTDQNKKWTLKKNSGKFNFKAQLQYGKIEFVLSGFQVGDYEKGESNAVVKIQIGKSKVQFSFYAADNKIVTKIYVNGKEQQITNNLEDGGILTFTISKDGRITLEELATVYPNTLIVIPSLGQLDVKKNVVKMIFDSSGLNNGVITLSFNTPVNEEKISETTMIIIVVVVVVIIVGLVAVFFICLFCSKCWLNKKFDEFVKRREERKMKEQQQTEQRGRTANINGAEMHRFTDTETNARNVTTTETQLTNTNVRTENSKSKPSKNKEQNKNRRNNDVPVGEPVQRVEPQTPQEQQRTNQQLSANIYIKENIDEQPRIPQAAQQAVTPEPELFSAKDITDDEGGEWIEVKRKSRKRKHSSENNDLKQNHQAAPEIKIEAAGGSGLKNELKPVTSDVKVDNHVPAGQSVVKSQEKKVENNQKQNQIKLNEPINQQSVGQVNGQKVDTQKQLIDENGVKNEDGQHGGKKADNHENNMKIDNKKPENNQKYIHEPDMAGPSRRNAQINNQRQVSGEADVLGTAKNTVEKKNRKEGRNYENSDKNLKIIRRGIPKKLVKVERQRRIVNVVPYNFGVKKDGRNKKNEGDRQNSSNEPDVAGPSRRNNPDEKKNNNTENEKTYGSAGSQTLDLIAEQAGNVEAAENRARENERRILYGERNNEENDGNQIENNQDNEPDVAGPSKRKNRKKKQVVDKNKKNVNGFKNIKNKSLKRKGKKRNKTEDKLEKDEKVEKTYGSVGSETLDHIAEQAGNVEQAENRARENERRMLERIEEEPEDDGETEAGQMHAESGIKKKEKKKDKDEQ